MAMILKGLQKTTLLDFPGKVACTVFTGGCNLRCPFCHNSLLVLNPNDQPDLDIDEFFTFLSKRRGILDGVAITGGEPLLNLDIEEFIGRIRDMGFLIKLDTNGFFPDRLEKLIDDGMLDYIAVDIKNTREKYGVTVGVPDINLAPLDRTISILSRAKVPYEYRTTAVAEYHTPDDFDKIGCWISGCPAYFIQAYKDSGSVISEGLHPLSDDGYRACLEKASNHLPNASLRGI
ncbi:MAG: anaerobic ribonucleoside-triphosphate reductase activating protein [Clostridia bacterium]|nr:anaerobic ribonucleoside-triphosphate reductase activating protein [Clostridia bacterium]